MKILQMINAPEKACVKYKHADGSIWQEPIVGLALIDDEGLTYVSPLVLSSDACVEILAEIERGLEDGVELEVVWNEA